MIAIQKSFLAKWGEPASESSGFSEGRGSAVPHEAEACQWHKQGCRPLCEECKASHSRERSRCSLERRRSLGWGISDRNKGHQQGKPQSKGYAKGKSTTLMCFWPSKKTKTKNDSRAFYLNSKLFSIRSATLIWILSGCQEALTLKMIRSWPLTGSGFGNKQSSELDLQCPATLRMRPLNRTLSHCVSFFGKWILTS